MELITDDILNTSVQANFVVLPAVIGLLGIAFNFVIVAVFVKLGFSDTTNISLLSLALADIGVLLTMVGYSVIYNPVVLAVTPSGVMDAVGYAVMGTSHVMFCRIAGCLTAFITVERFICIAWPLHVKSIVTPGRTTFTVVAIYVFMVSCTVPTIIANQIGPRFDPQLNTTVVGLVLSANADQLENFTLVVDIIAQVTSFVLVTLSTLGLIRSLLKIAKWRRSTSTSSQAAANVSGRDKQLVKMIVLISTVFIVCSLPTVVGNLVMIFSKDFNIKGGNKNLFLFVCGFFFLLDSINSTVNIFIYIKMSTKFRDVLLSFVCVVKEK
ncbi:unnamed protein product, partial [Lymnaea stagnalis]